MSCLCDKVKPIPDCVNEIVIGEIAPDTDVLIRFTDIITGRSQSVSATSDGDGLLTADVADIQEFFTPNFIYEIRVYLANTNIQINFTIDQVAKDCVEIQFETGTIESAILELVVVDLPTESPQTVIAPVATLSEDESEIITTPGVWTNSPTGYLYEWFKDGDPVGGNSIKLTTTGNGSYHCLVSASNAAGTAMQSSNSIVIS